MLTEEDRRPLPQTTTDEDIDINSFLLKLPFIRQLMFISTNILPQSV